MTLPKRYQRALENLLLLVFSLGTCVLVLELGLSYTAHSSDLMHFLLYEPNTASPLGSIRSLKVLLRATPLRLWPYAVTSGWKNNSKGLRTTEYTYEKPEHVRRIVALGDSFTSDSGDVPVPLLWHSLLAKALTTERGEEWETLNLGISGASPLFEVQMYEVEGSKLSPDLVVLGFFLGNDLSDLDRDRQYAPIDCYLCTIARKIPTIALHFREFWGAISLGSATDTGPGGFEVAGYTYDPKFTYRTREEFDDIEKGRSWIFAAEERAHADALIAEAADLMEQLQTNVNEHNIPLVVLLIPDELQVNRTLQRRIEPRVPQYTLDYQATHTRVLDAFRKKGIHTLDLLPAFKRETAKRTLYRPLDTHWNLDGNVLAARELMRFIQEENLLNDL